MPGSKWCVEADMDSRFRSLSLSVLAVLLLGALAVFTATGTLGPSNYAAVALVLLSIVVVGARTYAKAHSTRSLAQLVSDSDVGLVNGHDPRL
jgi:hypothetical protein